MTQVPDIINPSENPEVKALLNEVAQLEASLNTLKNKLSDFEQLIQHQLNKPISRILELYELYKAQKSAKKEKRLEQKKKGKNYKEPIDPYPSKRSGKGALVLDPSEQQELRRLYKAAVVKVHPDKINHGGDADKIQSATAITSQLNGLYQKGDLEELINFYQYVILGNPLSEADLPVHVFVNRQVRLSALKKKKETLSKQLTELQGSYTYQVLVTYENPHSFIDELRLQFQERIKQLEKRTRTSA